MKGPKMHTERQFHLHYARPTTPHDVRFLTPPDGGDGGGGGGGGGGTGGQVVFPSQEAVDGVIRERLARAKETWQRDIQAKYGDLDALKAKAEAADTGTKDLTKQLEDATKRADDAEAKVKDFEAKAADAEAAQLRAKLAKEAGLDPEKYADRLKGATEDELRADATALATLVGVKPAKGGTDLGGGTIPAGGGKDEPATLSEAIGSHYNKP